MRLSPPYMLTVGLISSSQMAAKLPGFAEPPEIGWHDRGNRLRRNSKPFEREAVAARGVRDDIVVAQQLDLIPGQKRLGQDAQREPGHQFENRRLQLGNPERQRQEQPAPVARPQSEFHQLPAKVDVRSSAVARRLWPPRARD